MKSEKVSVMKVSCSGTDESSKHPKIYLNIDPKTKQVVCPYCSKKFIYQTEPSANEKK